MTINLPRILTTVIFLFAAILATQTFADRPNILWITIEDWSPDLSCYGTKGIATPHVDKLASEGIRYETAFTTSPVCSTSRSAMMTGFHQNYIGAHQHRTDEEAEHRRDHQEAQLLGAELPEEDVHVGAQRRQDAEEDAVEGEADE